MYSKPEAPQQWSVHAEFTISHPGGVDPENLPQTRTEQGDNGVRMTYTWTSGSSNNTSWPSPPLSASNSHRSTQSEKAYGFQKGNLLFTSTPPKRPLNFPEVSPRLLGVQDSGYGSDLLSPNSLGSGGLHRRPIQPYGRKCRSTCNIVLSANVHDENRTTEEQQQQQSDSHTQCGRTQSLRCQTPTMRCDRKDRDSFYGCGDPWCHHIHYGDDFAGRISPVLETCEDVNSEQNVRCGSSVPRETRRDACVQTFEMIDKCTSPFLKYTTKEGKEKKLRKYGGRRKTEPIFQRSNTPSSITPDSLDNSIGSQKMEVRRSSRSKEQQRGSKEREGSTVDSNKSSDPSKKPRTVHIDVYCTGTEMESSNSSNNNDSSDNDTASTPQTVFESQKVRITHQRAKDEQLPFNVRKSKSSDIIKKKIEEKEQQELPQESDDDDDDDVSSAYPSKLSSYSTIRDFSSSISSVPKSWTTYSMSSCAVPDDYDSVANTSWKDTFSDIESLLQSRSSIAQTESLDFVPRKLYQKNASIDETPEIENKSLLETPSVDSLQASDSFEYANSEDRLRISKMEELWKTPSPKVWKSPQAERRHLLQQQKIQEYLQKRESSDKVLPKWESRDSDSDASDGSGKAYTFVKNSNSSSKVEKKQDGFTSKSPSILALQQRFSMDPSLRAPFTIVPGIYTDQRAIAKKFGSILPVVRKPGHHIGPVKNPDCLCDHCKRYYANLGYRGRTRSVGDPSSVQPTNWKDFQNYPTAESNSNRSVPSQLFTDF